MGEEIPVTDRRFTWALVAAAALHALVTIGVRSVRPILRPQQPTTPAEPHEEAEIEVLREDAPPAVPPEVPKSKPMRTPSSPEARARFPGSVRTAALPPSVEGDVPQAPPAEAAPSNSAWSAPPIAGGPSLEQLGLAGRNRFLGTPSGGAEASSTHDAELAVVDALTAPLRDRDRNLGLGAEGAVLQALEESTAEGLGTANDKATFEAELGADGTLLGLRVIDSKGPIEPWRAIADAARGAASRYRKRRAGGRGVVARIEVESRWQLPSGHDPGRKVSLFGLPVKKGEGPRSAHVELLNPVPKMICSEITTGSGKICVPMVMFTILSSDLDSTDFGTKALRTIRAHVTSEKAL